jgi:hypothetical protein
MDPWTILYRSGSADWKQKEKKKSNDNILIRYYYNIVLRPESTLPSHNVSARVNLGKGATIPVF